MTATDTVRSEHGLSVAALTEFQESILWKPLLHVAKYDDDATLFAARNLIGEAAADVSDKLLRRLVDTGVVKPLGADFDRLHIKPYDQVESLGNLLTNAGLTRLWSRVNANTDNPLANTTARLGVGDSTTTALVADTDLGAASGSTHRYFNPCDASNPSFSLGVMTLISTFASANGNFAWQEWGIDIGTATVSGGTTVNACLFNHKIASLGTKASGTSWVATATITIS